MNTLRRFDPHHGIQPIGTWWTLEKGTRRATCVLTTHMLGWELCVTVDGELIRSQVVKDEESVFDTADDWRRAWNEKGWEQP
jgi:hypothetical protein